MPCLPCGEKDVIANILNQDKCPTVPLQLVKFKPARYIVWYVFLVALNFQFHVQRKMAAGMSGPDNVVQCLPLACTASNRYVSNTHVFVSCCEASLK